MKKKKEEITIRSSAAEYLTYVASIGDQQDSIEMRYEDENIWLTQRMMATLYDVDVRTINEHIKKIYSDSELEEGSTIRNFRIVQTEGSRQVARNTKHYNLQFDMTEGSDNEHLPKNRHAILAAPGTLQVLYRKTAGGVQHHRACESHKSAEVLPRKRAEVLSDDDMPCDEGGQCN